jgi:hypothetical protein
MCTTRIPIDPNDAEPTPWRTDTARWMVRVFVAVAALDLVIVALSLTV